MGGVGREAVVYGSYSGDKRGGGRGGGEEVWEGEEDGLGGYEWVTPGAAVDVAGLG